MPELRIVGHRFALAAVLVVTVLWAGFWSGPVKSADAPSVGLWTIVIPEAFPDNVYTWRVKADGTYEEDGHDRTSGESTQPTLGGRWTLEGARMTLRQDNNTYVFDGTIAGERYGGTLHLGDKKVSHFCAAKGATAPSSCVSGQIASADESARSL